MPNNGRNPPIRDLIDEILERYADNTTTPDDLANLTDWDVVQHATIQ